MSSAQVWIIGRWPAHGGPWEVQGAFSTEAGAIEAAVEGEFIGALPLDARLPEDTLTWPGVRYIDENGELVEVDHVDTEVTGGTIDKVPIPSDG